MRPTLEIIEGTSSASLNTLRVPLADKQPYWHYHPEVELTYMARGQARVQVGNHIATCKAGDLLVLGSNLPHDFNPVDRTIACDFFVVQFRPDMLASFPELTSVASFLGWAGGGLLLEDTPVELVALFEAVNTAGPARRFALFLEMLVRITELSEVNWQSLSPHAVVCHAAEDRNHQRLQKVIACIVENFYRRIRLDEIANLVHMAPPSFSRWFRRTMQMTFTDYLNRVRIEECCRQLRFTDKPITFIARDCGFESFSSFNRQFRRLQDCTPSAWRRRHKHENR